MEKELDHTMRLDKWLWAARFFKTRSLASKHIELGRVQVNGVKTKTSKYIIVGDVIDLTLNSLPYKLTVLKLNHQRRPAPEARLLYQEDEKTAVQREAQKLLDQASRITAAYPDGRPTKRDRRQLDKVKRGDW
ncbi:RNA-binding S4 domain-containing protein [Kingella negevensis]|uniref:Heat shock protein 15 n=1 Tax=Kingella negevensis TaxID=1522312 RepID=A0A238HF11_9NEIS|nr:RNA-binding S4 domain-containing protein [Kingella negevensis]MDK4680680.1 RNA-binding S4 domain-containing protein [Kingella negevensis]MDK4681597.1 RNA-binding S4 domain-containing protein [Kingella negevensis]MDK4687747.1 RNA-binding S4 domain-containing protein [Kingella negevensis]MDK4689795.1 RNA-binding S4 domain-containing protein [Kingella negevensis]MDK4692861.1 RNA-binding S4 domain-containing protein [Kingella negevensis]